MCPRVVLSASITLGPLIGAFLSTHWWDFSVPLGGAVRLEQLEKQGHRAPGHATRRRSAGGRKAYSRRGPRSEHNAALGPLLGLGIVNTLNRNAESA